MNTTINIQLNQKKMERAFLKCLRDRSITSEFSYWGRQESEQWLSVCDANEYSVYGMAVETIKNHSADIVKALKIKESSEINFISFGVGNGMKDMYILKEIIKQNSKAKYFPIDISLDMLEEAIRNIFVELKPIDTTAFVADFDDFKDISARLREVSYDCHLVSMLGNTLGNFVGQVEVLNNIRGGMRMNDYLLVEVTMRRDDSSNRRENLTSLINSYNNDAYKDFVFTPLKKAGFKKTDGVIEVEYGPNQFYQTLYSIEIWFHLTTDKVVNYAGEEVIFKKDERIKLYVSHKYTRENMESLLSVTGFDLQRYYSIDGSIGMFLCTPKK